MNLPEPDSFSQTSCPKAKPSRRTEVGDWLILLALFVIICLPLPLWLTCHLAEVEGDSTHHVFNIINTELLLSQSPWSLETWAYLSVWPEHLGYPPLNNYVLGLIGAMAGNKLALPGLAAFQAIWLLVTAGSVYVLGCNLYATSRPDDIKRGRRVGLLAAALVLSCPLLLSQLTVFMLDLPSTALVAVSLATLSINNQIDQPWPAFLAGVCLALGLLVKWTVLTFTLPALCYLVFTVLARQTPRQIGCFALIMLELGAIMALVYWCLVPHQSDLSNFHWVSHNTGIVVRLWLELAVVAAIMWLSSKPLTKSLRLLVLMITISVLLPAPFYMSNAQALISRLDTNIVQADETIDGPTTPLQPLWRPNFLTEHNVCGGVLVLASLIWAASKKRRALFSVGLPWLCGVLTCNLVFWLLDARYYLPGIPLQILLVVGWLQTNRWTRIASLPLIAVMIVWQYACYLMIPMPFGEHHEQLAESGTGPSSRYYQTKMILERLDRVSPHKPVALFVAVTNEFFSINSFKAAAAETNSAIIPRSLQIITIVSAGKATNKLDLLELTKDSGEQRFQCLDYGLLNGIALSNRQIPFEAIVQTAKLPASELPGSLILIIGQYQCQYNPRQFQKINLPLPEFINYPLQLLYIMDPNNPPTESR